jgi:hypothetical protein
LWSFPVAVSVKEDDMRTVANWMEEKEENTTSEFDRFLGQCPVQAHSSL